MKKRLILFLLLTAVAIFGYGQGGEYGRFVVRQVGVLLFSLSGCFGLVGVQNAYVGENVMPSVHPAVIMHSGVLSRSKMAFQQALPVTSRMWIMQCATIEPVK